MNDHPELPQTGYVTREFVKRRYGISNSCLHQWQADGHFPKSVRIGPRAVRIQISALRAWESKLTASNKATG